MDLNKAKTLAAKVLKVGIGKIYIDPVQTTKVKEAMTKDDIRGLIADRIIKKRQENSQSKARSRKMATKRRKGRKRGSGKRKGTKKTRVNKKQTWVKNVRSQRRTLKELRNSNPEEVKEKGYSKTYRRIKGNYFKGKKYLIEYIKGGKQ